MPCPLEFRIAASAARGRKRSTLAGFVLPLRLHSVLSAPGRIGPRPEPDPLNDERDARRQNQAALLGVRFTPLPRRPLDGAGARAGTSRRPAPTSRSAPGAAPGAV